MKVIIGVILLFLIIGLLLFIVPFFFRERDVSADSKGIMISRDGGRSWIQPKFSEEIAKLLDVSVTEIVFDPINPDVVYLATLGKGILVSRDKGFSWERLEAEGALRQSSDIFRIVFGEKPPFPVYVAVFQDNVGVLLKSESKDTLFFREIYRASRDRFGVFDIVLDQENSNHIFIATGEGGVLYSRDGGSTWKALKWFPDSVIRLLIKPGSESFILALLLDGRVFRSDDQGVAWEEVMLPAARSSFIRGSYGRNLVADPTRTDTYFIVLRGGLFMADQNGKSIKKFNIIFPPGEVVFSGGVAVDPSDPKRILAAVGNRIYASEDRGVSWSLVGEAKNGKIVTLMFNPREPRVVWAGLQR